MSKMIEEIESNVQEEAQDESLDLATLLAKHGEEIDAFLDLVKAAQESGIFTFLKALFENKGESMSEISNELVKPQNIRFVRNLMSIYTHHAQSRPGLCSLFQQFQRPEWTEQKRSLLWECLPWMLSEGFRSLPCR